MSVMVIDQKTVQCVRLRRPHATNTHPVCSSNGKGMCPYEMVCRPSVRLSARRSVLHKRKGPKIISTDDDDGHVRV